MQFRLTIDIRRVVQGLAAIIAGLTCLSLLVSVINYFVRRAGLSAETLDEWNNIFLVFFLGGEINWPTWYASISLLSCAVLLALTAWVTAKRQLAYVRHWRLLAVIFLLMSIDEFVRMHEALSRYMRKFFNLGGIFEYSWTIVGAIFVLVVVAGYIRFVMKLPLKIRRLILLAGGAYVIGALGFEIAEGYYYSLYTAGHLAYELMIYAEEFLEMTGVAIFICALLANLQLLLENQPMEVVVQ